MRPMSRSRAQAYPPILALAGLTDPRVTYWEPAKWVAKLRATKTDDTPLYLKTHMGAGHGGASGRFERIKETALSYAFALQVRRIGIIMPRRDCRAAAEGLYHQSRALPVSAASPRVMRHVKKFIKEAPDGFRTPRPALCL